MLSKDIKLVISLMVNSHCTGTGPGIGQGLGIGSMGSNIL